MTDRVLSEAHRKYLMTERCLLPSTITRYGLYSSADGIHIPLGDLEKVYFPGGVPKMKWSRKGEDGEAPPPFPSIEGLRAADLLVEGEWDAMLAEQELGIPVASSTLGALGWRDEWTDALTGRSLPMLYDHDDAGAKGMRAIAEKLRAGGVHPLVAYWPAEKPKGYDITEHFRTGGTPEQLTEVIRHAKEYMPAGISLSMLEFITKDSEGPQMLVDQIWPKEGIGFIAGNAKVGKSFLATELAMAVASGEPFLGSFRVPFPQRVLLVQSESSLAAYQQRVRSAMRRYGRTDWLYIISNRPFDLLDARACEQLEAEVDRVRPAMIVLDNLATFVTGDENSAQEMGKFVRFVRDIRDRFKTAFVIVHHASRAEGRHGGQKMRGSTALYAAAEAMLVVERMPEEILTSRVTGELKEGGGTAFMITLDPATQLLQLSDRPTLKQTVQAINRENRAWQQTEHDI